MNKNSNFFIVIFLLVNISLFNNACKKENENSDPEIQEIIDQTVQSVRISVENEIGKTIPSLNIFIQTPDGSWFSSSAAPGYQPITADTYFRFASNTKSFTASSALKMMQDGWLDLDANISDTIPGGDIPYVPKDTEWDIPFKNQITLRMLLNHSAGIYDVDNDSVPGCMGEPYTIFTLGLDPDHQFTATEMVKQLAIYKLYYFPPGTGHHYSNTGYTILGEIISRIYSFHAGEPKTLSDYLYEQIHGPTSSVPIDIHFPKLASDKYLPEPYSCGLIYKPNNVEHEYCSFNMSAHIAEGNGYGTMRNLNTWIRSLIKGKNILTPATVELMKNSTSTAAPHYGLGCFYIENLGYGHNGNIIGNLTTMMYDPLTDVSVVSYISAVNEISLEGFFATYYAITDVAYSVREALGYPGKP